MPKNMSKISSPTLPTPVAKQLIDYNTLFDSLPNNFIAFFVDDPLFTIAAENQAHAKIAMVKTADILGKPVFDVFPDTSNTYLKDGYSELLESFRTVIRTGKPDTMLTLQYNIKRPDGSFETRYWKLTHSPIFDDAGKVFLICQSSHDITRSSEIDQKLKQTQQQLSEALSSGIIGTWLWDIRNNIVKGDKYMADMFGVSAEQAATGLPLDVFAAAIHPDDRSRVQSEIELSVKLGTEYNTEYRAIGVHEKLKWIVARGKVEYDSANKPVNFPGVLLDITDRKISENNLIFLSKASKILSSLLDYNITLQAIAKLIVPEIADWCSIEIIDSSNTLQQVAIAHADSSKVAWATELRKKYGPPSLVQSAKVPQVIQTGQTEFYPQFTDALLLFSAKDKKELKMLKELKLTSVIIVPLTVSNTTIGVITLMNTASKRSFTSMDVEMAEELANCISLAITNTDLYNNATIELAERTRLEEALRKANSELESRVVTRTLELNETNLNLQRSNQELQDFAYVASHDLQEPLRKIQAFGNLLETEYSAELGEGMDYLGRMQSAASRMSALIEGILSFSRVTTKARSFDDVNLSQICQEVISDLEVRITDTKAIINIAKLPTIQADSIQMRQLLQNLLANSLKFQREGVEPVIHIRASTEIMASNDPVSRAKIGYCRLEIEDNGIGFDEKYLDRIFAVFQRLHSRDSYGGTGIGLAVCRKIVERHGGAITATSRSGQGSTFIVRLPIRHKKGDSSQ